MFYGCTSLSSVNLPSGLEAIGARAFEGCISLTEILVPASVKSIGLGAFDQRELEIRLEIAEEDKPDGWVPGWNNGKPTLVWEYAPEPEDDDTDTEGDKDI